MWRTVVLVLLAAIVGSALATTIYVLGLSSWQDGVVPSSPEDLHIAFAVFLGALWFTIPGASLLLAVDSLLSATVLPSRAVELSLVAAGAVAGAAILGGLNFGNDTVRFGALGGFYGFTTAIAFVFLRRPLCPWRARS